MTGKRGCQLVIFLTAILLMLPSAFAQDGGQYQAKRAEAMKIIGLTVQDAQDEEVRNEAQQQRQEKQRNRDQQQREYREGDRMVSALTFPAPGGDGQIVLEREGLQQVRAGESYEYKLRITKSSAILIKPLALPN